jgi:hypothetical protein
MIKILLALAAVYFVIRLLKVIQYLAQRPSRKEEGPLPPFSDIQDAKFEDITPESPDSHKPND